MTAIKDLFGSERGLLGLILIVCCTVLAAIGKMTFDAWQEYTMWIFGIYVGGKTVTGAVQLAKGAKEKDVLEMSEAELATVKTKANAMFKTLWGIDLEQQMADSKAASAAHEKRMAELDAEIARHATPEPPKAA